MACRGQVRSCKVEVRLRDGRVVRAREVVMGEWARC